MHSSIGRTPVGKKRQRCVQLLVRQLPPNIAIATDYKTTLITPCSLGFESKDFGISYSADDTSSTPETIHYRAKVDFTESFTFGNLMAYLSSTDLAATPPASKSSIIQAANIIFDHGMKQNNGIIVKSNKFFPIKGPLSEHTKLGTGLEAYRGFFLSVRALTGRILLNTQVKHIAVYQSMRLDQLIMELRKDGQDFFEIDRFIHKLYVQIQHLSGCVKQVVGLASRHDGVEAEHRPVNAEPGVSSSTLQDYDHAIQGYSSFADYFKKQHKPLQYPDAAVVNVGTQETPVYMPPEVCYIRSGQAYRSKLSPDATANMIKFAVRQPVINAKTIVGNGAQLIQDHSAVMLGEFGINNN